MANYYNENDPKVAAWLNQLIADGLIPKGEVDGRSIVDVRTSDLAGFAQCHFFAGIAGWSLALQLAGWPEDRPVWTGSCPCPPFSCAGKKKTCPSIGCGCVSILPHPFKTGVFACCECGHEWVADTRHLWPEFYRLIRECRPAIVFGEQVNGKDGEIWLSGVRACLEIEGYGVGTAELCSGGVGAPNRRQRLYWVADAACKQIVSPDAFGLHAESCGGGPDERMVDPIRSGLEERISDGGIQSKAVRAFPRETIVGPSYPGHLGVDQPNGPRCCEGCESTAPTGHGNSVGPTSGDGNSETLDKSDCRRLQDADQQPRNDEKTGVGQAIKSGIGSPSGFWDDWELVHFIDGKTRRIKSGTQCLASRISGDVDLLRAFGNAINPRVAAEFIKAFVETVS